MKNKIIKSILGILAMTVSPFILLSIVGILYVIFQMVGGATFSAGFQSFFNIVYSLSPYFGYMTTVPIIILAIVLYFKFKHKTSCLFRKR